MASPQILFVCLGNICRSAMAERVAKRYFADHGIDAKIWSAGVSDEEHGNPMDPRARATLTANGYDPDGHRAHQVTAAEIARADIVIGFEPFHVERMKTMINGSRFGRNDHSAHNHDSHSNHADKIALLTDFDPNATPGSSVRDPWYGPQSGFVTTLHAIEAAMPGIAERARNLTRHSDPEAR